jgi:tetratricopeptide (TPR) repeat protein
MTRRVDILRLSLPMAMLIAGLGVASIAPAAGDAPSRLAPGPSSPARSGVEAGWDLLRQGRHREAVGVFTEAKIRYRDEPMLFLGLGVARYRLLEFGPAVEHLRRALELNPYLEEAHSVLGAISFARDELDSSIRHYEKAFELNPNDVGIQDRLFAVRRAADAEGMLHRLNQPHVIVKYDPSYRHVALRVAERWEVIHRRIGRLLEDIPAERTIVILYANDRFRRLTDTPVWAAGLFDGRVHVAVGAMQTRPEDVDASLAHEYAHVVVHRLAGGRAPVWLEEGLALYFEGRDRTWSRDILKSAGVDLIPLHALHESFLGFPAEQARIAYAESYSAACALIDRYGLKQVRRLLASVAEAPDFAAAFETVLKSPYHEFEAGWALAERQRRL